MKNAIPESVLMQHTAFLGKTGSGKTSTAKLAVEQILRNDPAARVCILDAIKSDWWGLTSSADGTRPGLPFVILGGPRGHVPLNDSAGKAIGELVANGSLPLSIIDMADFAPGGLQKFFNDFAPALMRRMRGVVYLVLEEAHEFAPKERSGIGAETVAIHWAKKLATAGRSKGIRLMVLTQRTQALHNALLGSCDTMIAHRLTAPADQTPVQQWLKANVDKATFEQVASSMASLKTGSAWICSGEAQVNELVHFPPISTYDNSATPTSKSGEHAVKTAPVDPEKLKAIIGDALKNAQSDDPRALKAEVARLSAANRDADKMIESLRMQNVTLRSMPAVIDRGAIEGALSGLASKVSEIIAKASSDVHYAAAEAMRADGISAPKAANRAIEVHDRITKQVDSVMSLTPPREYSGVTLPKAERQLLRALAQYPQGRTKRQAAILAGYAVNGGGFNNAIGSARSAGRLDKRGDLMVITDAGLDDLGRFEPLPHGDALLAHWMAQLAKAERSILSALAGVYPDSMGKSELAEAAGYEASGGGFNNALGKLRALELISGSGSLVASEALFG